jgi:SAM-dependent methyltransferase
MIGSRAKTRPPDPIEESLGRGLLGLDGGLGLFRWVHLLDAVTRAGHPRSALSIGSGGGFHESLLAYRNPGVSVCGVDLRAPYAGVDLPNLTFRQGDLLDPEFAGTLPDADFVFSIECLEHIREDHAVFARMAELVRPGGFLYLEVPFASPGEQADPEVCRAELETFEHLRPGYDAAQLERLALAHELAVVAIAGAFWVPLAPICWLAQHELGAVDCAPHWRTFLAMAELDLRDGLPAHRAEATAIKLLARKPGRR